MPFPRKLLNDGEDIVLDLHPHWWFFAGPTLAFAGSVALALGVSAVFDVPALGLTALALMAAAALWWLLRYLQWVTTNFVVTTDRLIYRTGVLGKSGREIPLDRLNDIAFRQSIFERLLRAGDLTIESAGELGQQHFTDIPKPVQVQNVIYAEIERAKDRDADRMAGRGQLSIPEQIDKLDELRQRGVLTQAEFDAKKTQLLDRL